MKFSICIPNYNYEAYLGRTLDSVLTQSHADLEVLVSDNASTDGSVSVIRARQDARVQLRVNRCNVGFSGNLDRAARMATGDVIIMLSSDDLIRPGTLARYQTLFAELGPEWSQSIVCSTWDVVDPQDRITGSGGPNPLLWKAEDRVPELERALGAPVYRVAGEELLRRSIRHMLNPFNFAATAYPRTLYDAIEGYGGGRLMNPDRWFHWRLLSVAKAAYFVDAPLFAYRVHSANQTAQQAGTGALKYLVDEYLSTLELDARLLERLGLSRVDVVRFFVDNDIGRHGLSTLARGDRVRARRILGFGWSVYPDAVVRNPRSWALASLLVLGPLGERVARVMRDRMQKQAADARQVGS
jgi:glycosyltransferase involved in cell wall biosynthesis